MQKLRNSYLRQGKAYFCTCSQEQVIERLSKNPGFDPNFIKYDGYCRNKGNKAGALRFKKLLRRY